MAYEQEEWIPITGLGKQVAAGEFTSLKEVLEIGRPIKESGIVDYFLPDLEDEVHRHQHGAENDRQWSSC